MTPTETEKLVAEIQELSASASLAPWRSMRDGNQYLRTAYMPTAQLVGASRIDGVARPWNPHAYVAHGFEPAEFETVRFKDADADLVAFLRNNADALATALSDQAKEIERFSEIAAKYRYADVAGMLILCGEPEAVDVKDHAEKLRALIDGLIMHRRRTTQAESAAQELRTELQAYRDAALYDALMEGPRFKGWNRSQLDRARAITEHASRHPSTGEGT